MRTLYGLFPLSDQVRQGDMRSLLITLIIYVLAAAITAILRVVLGWIPLVGALLGVISVLLYLYCVAGGVLAGGAEPSASGLPQAASSDRVRAPERARARSFLFILHKLL